MGIHAHAHDPSVPPDRDPRSGRDDYWSRTKRNVAYLLHFSAKIADHAGHYLGSADDLDQRLAEHRQGKGARLTQVAVELGIELTLVRTWPGGRHQERQLKRRHNGRKLCPVCSPRTSSTYPSTREVRS